MKLLVAFFLAFSAFCQTQTPPAPATPATPTTPAQQTISTTSSVPPRDSGTNAFDRASYATAPPVVHALSGKVLIAGQPPANPIPVAVECAGASKTPRYSAIALTDKKGRFQAPVDAIAPQTPGESGAARLRGCSVRIRVIGFEPYNQDLARLIATGGAGRLIELKKVAGRGDGTTISATGFRASKRAWDEYGKALTALAAARPDEAARRLEAAVESYPDYAAAWFVLGEIRDGGGAREAARKAYQRAAAADAQYVTPRIRLARMAAEDRDWAEASRLAAEAIALAPGQFPEAYLLRATAEFNRGDYSNAEHFATVGLSAKGDPEPQLDALLEKITERAGRLAAR